ncbi:hypothetical protein JCM17844_17300 [Iodidimonas gelatinilytica]|uniref:DUF4112 domain-containing protein n=1 Tax=Iodidimonas gelatinilytica TaxID=1236966 RepID=A0A5A7MSA6_9PROT|nr:DUF4112 domain-containing protein [Iodidimonas gelatinilytica]GEQ98093.1 hypothetical protein JCM17844_17300 [Iodidimonas gelatinilytica]
MMDRRLKRLEGLARLLDSRFRIPGLGIRVGLDAVIGLIPGIGDMAMGLVSVYLVTQALAMGSRKRVIAQMLANIGIDFIIGAIPVIGDIFDIGFKANNRNIALLKRDYARHRL